MFKRLESFATRAGSLLMTLCAIGVLIMMIAVVIQVMASRLGVTVVFTLPGKWPLLGDEITLNSLTDLQWHLLAAVALLPVGVIWLRDAHVRVDFAYSSFRPSMQAALNLLGHAIFALPFLLLVIPDAWDITLKAFERGERSFNGGLIDRYLVRAVLPIGLTLLLMAVVFETWQLVRYLGRRDG